MQVTVGFDLGPWKTARAPQCQFVIEGVAIENGLLPLTRTVRASYVYLMSSSPSQALLLQ